MRWAVGALAVLLLAAIALGSVVIVSMRRDISSLQHPVQHPTSYVTLAELNRDERFLLDDIARAGSASDITDLQNTVHQLQSDVSCLREANAVNSAYIHQPC